MYYIYYIYSITSISSDYRELKIPIAPRENAPWQMAITSQKLRKDLKGTAQSTQTVKFSKKFALGMEKSSKGKVSTMQDFA